MTRSRGTGGTVWPRKSCAKLHGLGAGDRSAYRRISHAIEAMARFSQVARADSPGRLHSHWRLPVERSARHPVRKASDGVPGGTPRPNSSTRSTPHFCSTPPWRPTTPYLTSLADRHCAARVRTMRSNSFGWSSAHMEPTMCATHWSRPTKRS